MDAKEKRQLETELTKMGLAGLTESGLPSGQLVQQLAGIVNSWEGVVNKFGEWVDKHKFVRDLLNECEPAARASMYDALKPYLKFAVKPLSHYEALIAERAGNLVSQRRMRVEGDAPKPVEVGGNKYAAAPKAVATHAVATLSCYHCHRSDRFVADTPVAAMTEGRRAGWTREKGINKEICPNCSIALAETVVRLADPQGKPYLEVVDKRHVRLDS